TREQREFGSADQLLSARPDGPDAKSADPGPHAGNHLTAPRHPGTSPLLSGETLVVMRKMLQPHGMVAFFVYKDAEFAFRGPLPHRHCGANRTVKAGCRNKRHFHGAPAYLILRALANMDTDCLCSFSALSEESVVVLP